MLFCIYNAPNVWYNKNVIDQLDFFIPNDKGALLVSWTDKKLLFIQKGTVYL